MGITDLLLMPVDALSPAGSGGDTQLVAPASAVETRTQCRRVTAGWDKLHGINS